MDIEELKRKIKYITTQLSNLNIYSDKSENLKREFSQEWEKIYLTEINLYKFILEQELKNLDIILDILKFIISLSISIFIASLTTSYFAEKAWVIFIINSILIILLVFFIFIRKNLLKKHKDNLLQIFRELSKEKHEYLISNAEKIISDIEEIILNPKK